MLKLATVLALDKYNTQTQTPFVSLTYLCLIITILLKMVRHNNMIPNGHFHKKWHKHVKTWFNQPAKKLKRRKLRTIKVHKMAPRPMELLRPIVRCPSVRYHTKLRIGRGFTLQELKAAGLNKRYARTIGICVEHRRRNRSIESLQQNVAKLKNYLAKLVVYPLNKKKRPEASKPEVLMVKGLNVVSPPQVTCKAKVPSEEEKAFNAFAALRKARNEGKKIRRKLQRKYKEEGFDDKK